MTKRTLVSAIIAGAVLFTSTSAAADFAIRPAVDSAAERDALRKFSQCVAAQRPRWGRALLAQPYLSNAQAEAAAEVISGQDHCLGQGEREMTFRTSTIVAAVAEQFLRADLARVDFDRVSRTLQTVPPANASEDFGLCVAAQSPKTARDLALSDPGSPVEAEAVEAMSARIPPCTREGEKLDVDSQSLRALVATALYKATSATLGSGQH